MSSLLWTLWKLLQRLRCHAVRTERAGFAITEPRGSCSRSSVARVSSYRIASCFTIFWFCVFAAGSCRYFIAASVTSTLIIVAFSRASSQNFREVLRLKTRLSKDKIGHGLCGARGGLGLNSDDGFHGALASNADWIENPWPPENRVVRI